MIKIGIIGGSGLDNPEILLNAQDLEVNTPYGKPSSPLKSGQISGVEVILLARHGREHTIPPTQINFQANIQALKNAGCTHILATTACGSLRKDIGRGDFVILDQFIDFTRHRKVSFHEQFELGKIVHTPMAEPFSNELRNILINTCQELGLKHHPQGTVVTIEGPRFSTKAESKMFSVWGADVINMSIAPEAVLSNEAGIPYVAVAMSTDYDCLFDDVPSVTWEDVLKVFEENVGKVIQLITNAIPKVAGFTPTVPFLEDEEEITSDDAVNYNAVSENDVDTRVQILKSKIKTYPNWPKEGIMFRDINSLLRDPEGFNILIDVLVERYKHVDFDVVAGIESRGFITGSILAHKLGKSFVLIRKPGKLPGETISQEYTLEYGTDKVEIQREAIKPGSKVLLVDDLIATGGTALASAQLIRNLGGEIVECSFVIDLPDIGGRTKLVQNGFKVFNVVEFEGD
ncbi:MAG: S-methyl-5'-thioadenosine phosphorylase [archaeon]